MGVDIIGLMFVFYYDVEGDLFVLEISLWFFVWNVNVGFVFFVFDLVVFELFVGVCNIFDFRQCDFDMGVV